jgi:hypothetical protein
MPDESKAFPDPLEFNYALAVHELGHAWAFHNASQPVHHVALGPMEDCSACKALPPPLENSALEALRRIGSREHAHVRQPNLHVDETLEQNIRCTLAGAAAQELCNAIHDPVLSEELGRVVDQMAGGDFRDLEDTFCEKFDDWETSEERQHQTDELLRIVYSDLLAEMPAEKLKAMAAKLVRTRLLLAQELTWE